MIPLNFTLHIQRTQQPGSFIELNRPHLRSLILCNIITSNSNNKAPTNPEGNWR